MRMAAVLCAAGLLCMGFLPLSAADSAPPVAEEISALKAQLTAQQQQIQQLQELLRRQGQLLEALQRRFGPESAAGNPGPDTTNQAAPPDLQQVAERVEAVAEETRELGKDLGSVSRKADRLGNFKLSGDLRMRYEPFFQESVTQRHRERAWLHFQVEADITRELSGGIRLASGQLEDPVSANQTLTEFFTRKVVGFDRYWMTYKPERLPWLALTAGKFDYPWYRTELSFDNELQPEGFAETLSFDFHDSPLTSVRLVGFQLPFNEVAAGGDSFVWGGQVQTQWKVGDRTSLGLYAAGLNFRNVDAIAVALGAGTLRPSLPLSNSVRRDADGNIIGYAERFAYLDLIAELNYRWKPRWPVRLTFDFVNNVRGSRERSGYWGEVALGRTAEKGDWQFGYTLIRIERDAVIGAYSFSDPRAATNVINHRLIAAYQTHRNVTLRYTLYVGRLFNAQDNLNLVPPAFQPLNQDPYLKRMQFDVYYKF